MSHGSTPSLETPTPPFNLAASKLIAVVLIGILACGLRFTKLGDWTFAGDELATTEETKMLFGELSADPSIPEYRLPRIIPLSYPILYVGYHAFGESEFGSRVVSAIFGTLLPPLIVFCLWSLFGPYSATAAGLLLACSPEAIFQSQQNRFYTILALVTGVCVGLAALGVTGRRVWLFALACGLAIIAPLFHPVLVGLAFGLVAIVTVTMPSGMDGTKQRYWLMAVAASVVVTGVVVGYQMPQLSGWNSGAKWGYSSARAILGGVSQLGVSTTVFVGLGMLLLFEQRHPARWFWSVWVFGWVASLVALPKMIPYHPSYSFPYLIGPICVAGFAVGELARRMPGSGLLAIAWLAAPVLFNLPALVSHYSDGSRYDFRSAAKYVAEHRRPEEDVAAVAPAYLIFYEPRLGDVVTMSPSRLLEDLQAVEQRGRPTWIMLIAGRSGREPAVQNWINANCRLVKSFRRTRFDFHDYIYDVYKYDTRPAPIPTKP